MKFLAMTAAIAFSTAAFAQTPPNPNTPPSGTPQTVQDGATTPAPTDSTSPAPDAPMQDSTTPAPTQDSMTPAPTPDATTPAPMQGDTMQPSQQPMQQPGQPMQQPSQQPMAATGEDPKGGYMPSQPPIAGARTPGAQVQFVAAPPPSQAYPAPAPLESYPVCKRGQTDGCRNRGE